MSLSRAVLSTTPSFVYVRAPLLLSNDERLPVPTVELPLTAVVTLVTVLIVRLPGAMPFNTAPASQTGLLIGFPMSGPEVFTGTRPLESRW